MNLNDLPYLLVLDRRDVFDFVRAAIRDALESADASDVTDIAALRSEATDRTVACLKGLYENTPTVLEFSRLYTAALNLGYSLDLACKELQSYDDSVQTERVFTQRWPS